MTDWNPADLAAIDRAGELDVAAHRPDGTLRTPRIVWHVVVDDQLFVRSVRGTEGAWYRGVQRTGTGRIESGGVAADVTFTDDHDHDAAIDQAYRAKYGGGSAVAAITSPTAAATTLRVDPA
ncbi:hypothetical protein ATJ88_0229 [Isoptericola jiangsuensis]|uniref:DUF2255 family protein n=1 Tax=Isoptericola jiangsuensis TaxID=548579 RepID=A0A2A9ER27_9MICO|nr:DUF2255 family protein [Isoptericola jiangsuensis]PFG41587.1 hypothetical protein ATJ88_0229 [Isoptericola jiangsuensis]